MAADVTTPTLGARGVALKVLDDTLERREPPEARLAQLAEDNALSSRDRAFARLLLTTVLRHKAALDQALAPLLRHAPPPRVFNLLRLGAAQLLYLKTPPHAAVDEMVNLAKAGRQAPPALVNAVLRRLVGGDPPELAPLATLAPWLAERWQAAYGAATTAAIARVQAAEPPLDLTIKADAAGWAERLGGTVMAPATVRLRDAGPIEQLPGYAEGAWWVQDLAATLPARVLAPGVGERVLDLCAAPGGKTAQLAAMGAKVTSIERHPRRAERLALNLDRLGLAAAIELGDALEISPAEPFPAVLLDAPCTATGTLRRHPDIMWTKGATDVAKLAALQARLLIAAAAATAPGGRLVYAVCSLEPEEGEAVVQQFLETRGDFTRLPIDVKETGFTPTEAGDLRTHPALLAEAGGMDGFYIARLVRSD